MEGRKEGGIDGRWDGGRDVRKTGWRKRWTEGEVKSLNKWTTLEYFKI